MNNPLFGEVREAIFEWVKHSDEKLRNNNISVEILIDEVDCLRIEFNFGEILAEAIVEEACFEPYRYIYFRAIGIVNGVPDLLYFWYDEDGMGIEEIIEGLDKSITIVREKNNPESTTSV
jgi:hypothetical protein